MYDADGVNPHPELLPDHVEHAVVVRPERGKERLFKYGDTRAKDIYYVCQP